MDCTPPFDVHWPLAEEYYLQFQTPPFFRYKACERTVDTYESTVSLIIQSQHAKSQCKSTGRGWMDADDTADYKRRRCCSDENDVTW